MLKIPNLPKNEQAAEIVRNFINNRLIAMMERIIEEEMAFKLIMSGKGAGDLGKKPLDEVIDMDELMQDMDFAENVSLMYLPDNYPKEKANREFIGLYKLPKAKQMKNPGKMIMRTALPLKITSTCSRISGSMRECVSGILTLPFLMKSRRMN